MIFCRICHKIKQVLVYQQVIIGLLQTLIQQGVSKMADLKSEVQTLAAEVATNTDTIAQLITLNQSQAAEVKDLAAHLAAMPAVPTPEVLQALADLAAKVHATNEAAAAAIKANSASGQPN